MAPSISYIITRFAKSVFTGPVKPTPGTAIAFANTKTPDADKGFNQKEWASGHFPDQTWPPTKPPIQIKITNLARPADSGMPEEITLVGINTGGLQDNGSTPTFQPSTVIGRSSPYQIYRDNAARTVKLSIPIHRDMFEYYRPMGVEAQQLMAEYRENYQSNTEYWKLQDAKRRMGDANLQNYEETISSFLFRENAVQGKILEAFKNTINWFRALQYPVYTAGGVIAPRVKMIVGDFIAIEGYPSVDLEYGNNYTENFPISVKVGVQVTETVQTAYDQAAIYNKNNISVGMNYVEWPNKQ